ncbi:fibronectin type III-like domain-contianing protein [Duncaniella muris]|uniref:fibronectin type III-like domain-contianing protein n=1 Tax=Duncaniella muris TaxID=2094150 RepID=UPI0025A67EB2|nr:fibronectin type III-like domain-contianing protein [Duncaniella muris]
MSNEPLYPFGYGCSYTTFAYSKPYISTDRLAKGGAISLSIDVSNAGDYDGYEIVQLYINDPVARIARPVKELKSYKRVFIPKGETVNVSFEIDSDMLKYYDNELKYGYDPGEFRVMVGPDSKDLQSLIFYAE